MAAFVDNNNKIIVPFLPPLFHLARVKVAAPLLTNFGYKTLERAFAEIQSVNSTESSEDFEENGNENYNIAKEKILNIPGHLRKSVLEAVNGMQHTVDRWQDEYSKILLLEHKRNHTLHWKSDGTIDECKTAKELVLSGNLDIKKRFEIACMYCFVKEIQTLLVEIEASGEVESFDPIRAFDPMIRFWLGWIADGAKVPWFQAARKYLEPPVLLSPFPRLSLFFPLLQPEDRQKFLKSFQFAQFADYDDLRFFLYALTAEEEEQIVKENILVLNRLYSDWPLKSLFLETVEKAWDYMDEEDFKDYLFSLDRKTHRRDFDYCGLLTEFWHRSPTHLRENAERAPSMKIYLDKIKRKAVDDEIQQRNLPDLKYKKK